MLPLARSSRLNRAAFVLAGVVAVVGWSLHGKDPAVAREPWTTLPPETENPGATDKTEFPGSASAAARSRAHCAGCGVIEAVRTVYDRVEIAGHCEAGDGEATRIRGQSRDAEAHAGHPRLGDIIALATPGGPRATSVRVTTRYQMVVRMRDGSKRTFDEQTPRSFRPGERVQLIEGATEMLD